MGFTIPAAIGAKLACPDRQVIGIAGDGDFLQTMQELAAAVMANTAVVIVILDNQGWISIKFGQTNTFGRATMVDFLKPDGSLYRIDYRAIGSAFGIPSQHVSRPDEIGPAIKAALAADGPALIAIEVARDFPDAALERTGWWDIPVPERHSERRKANLNARAEEQHLG
jgi:acetolactate synthase-1/2/3 large subunit